MTDRGHLTPKQIEVLLRPIKANRIEHANGMSHLAAWDVIAHLTRMFGFEGWDKEILSTELLFETSNTVQNDVARPKWTVAYRCSMRLTVFDRTGKLVKVTEDVSTGEAINQPSRGDAHDLALKSAVSGALKRCAKDLGDGFGLSLYDKGSQGSAVKASVAYDGMEAPTGPVLVEKLDQVAALQDARFAPIEGDGPVWDDEPPPAEPLLDEFEEWDRERAENRSEEENVAPERITPNQKRYFESLCKELQYDRHGICHEILGVPVESISDLSKAQAKRILDELTKRKGAMYGR